MRPRRLVVAFLAPYLAGLAVLGGVALASRSDGAFTLGVVPGGFVPLAPAQVACESGVDVPEPFDRVQPLVGTYRRPGPPLRAEVRTPAGRLLGRGIRAGGYPDTSRVSILVGHVAAGQRVSVCVWSPTGRVALYSNRGGSAPAATFTRAGQPIDVDVDLRFGRAPRSRLSELPEMLRHAALFKAGGVGPWTLWLLLVAILVGAPALALGAALTLPRGGVSALLRARESDGGTVR